MRGPIWDGWTRFFHWSLVLLVAAAWWTAENDEMEWHLRIGMAVFVLLVFRLVWGLIGGSTSRFASFVHGPGAIFAYLRGRFPAHVGHNPLGALSVLGLLAGLLLVVGLGLIGVDEDGLAPGPLYLWVGEELSEEAIELHEHEAFDLLLVLIGLHVAAVLFYALVKRHNLLGPMISGRGEIPKGAEALQPASAGRAVLAWLIALGLGWWVWAGAPVG